MLTSPILNEYLKFSLLVIMLLTSNLSNVHAAPIKRTNIDESELPNRVTITLERNTNEAIDLEAEIDTAITISKKLNPKEIAIVLPSGRIELKSTLNLDSLKTTASTTRFFITSPESSRTTLTGTRPLTNIKPASDIFFRSRGGPLRESMRGKVYEATAPAESTHSQAERLPYGHRYPIIETFPEIYLHDSPLRLASWPNTGYSTVYSHQLEEQEFSLTLTDQEGRHKYWTDTSSSYLHGYWKHDWGDEALPISAINPSNGKIRIKEAPPLLGIRNGARLRILGTCAELDEIHEWCYDSETGVYLIGLQSTPEENSITISTTKNLLSIRNASNLTIERIDFVGCKGNGILVFGGDNVTLKDVTLRGIGGRAVTLEGKGHKLVDSRIEDNGQGGVLVRGGNRTTLSPGNITVEGNYLSGNARIAKTYRPSIRIEGVGNIVRRNWIRDQPHAAIIFTGNDHLIELNEIEEVATEASDAGAIYTGRDWMGRGNIIRLNYIHNIRGLPPLGATGIYLDDQASGTTIVDNIFGIVHRAILLGGGSDNVISGNLVIDSDHALWFDARGLTWQRAYTESASSDFKKGLGLYIANQAAYESRYPELRNFNSSKRGEPKGNIFTKNIVVDSRTLLGDMSFGGLHITGNTSATRTELLAILSKTSIPSRNVTPSLEYKFILQEQVLMQGETCAKRRWLGRRHNPANACE